MSRQWERPGHWIWLPLSLLFTACRECQHAKEAQGWRAYLASKRRWAEFLPPYEKRNTLCEQRNRSKGGKVICSGCSNVPKVLKVLEPSSAFWLGFSYPNTSAIVAITMPVKLANMAPPERS